MTKLFAFDPKNYAPILQAQDYVYIPQGVTAEAYEILARQVDEFIDARRMPEFARGHKQQSLYDFPADGDFYRQFVETLAVLGGVDPDKLVISERHIKAYEADSPARPMPHKDRLATQFALGFTIRNPNRSTLVLYPAGERSVNPFQSWAEMRTALPPEKLPPKVLEGVPRVAFQDQPRDVLMFRGNEIWHGRENGAGTVMLYFKLNAFHSDPLGEDPRTEHFTQQTRRLAALPDEELERLVPQLGRRLDCLHRRYNCLWQEELGAILMDGPHLSISEEEFALLRACDGAHNLAQIVRQRADGARESVFQHVRRLAQLGILDLLPPAPAQATADRPTRESVLVG